MFTGAYSTTSACTCASLLPLCDQIVLLHVFFLCSERLSAVAVLASRRLQYVINMHPLVGVAALSPHVGEIVKTRMKMHHVHWMMPVLPVSCNNNCWEGFAVQGK